MQRSVLLEHILESEWNATVLQQHVTEEIAIFVKQPVLSVEELQQLKKAVEPKAEGVRQL